VSKYNWTKLKRQFLTGNYTTLKSFSIAIGINYNILRDNAKNWLNEKRQKDDKTTAKILEKSIEKEVDRNTRHLNVWDKFLKLGEHLSFDNIKEAIKNPYGLDNLEKLAKILERVQRGQRLAEGLDKPKQPDSNKDNPIVIHYIDAELSESDIEELLDD